jgi:S-disulfanyl-L-cysteine oxidoreductase SoxD
MSDSRQLASCDRAHTRSVSCRRLVIGSSSAFIALLTAVQVAAIPSLSSARRHPLGPGTVWDSIYTMEQAARGEATYRASCASCHGDSLAGINDAPPLAGPAFLKTWNGNTLAFMFNKISNDMPSDNPGTLTKPQVADILAFVLKSGGYPAGKAELPPAPDTLAQIRFVAKP